MQKIIFLICLSFAIMQIRAQNIEGKVLKINSKNKTLPLIGANVFWENTNVGTITDNQGRYSIQEPTNFPATLNVSYIGYSLKDKKIVNNEYIFYMESSIDLEEVNIKGKKQTTIFSTVKPLNVQTITADEILKAACCNLSECFETNAAVDVSYADAISGIKTIKMLGLNGKYVQISNESVPLIDGLLNSYGLSYVPGSWIESIQVTKGIGSVLNGYSSMTGQININYFNNTNSDDLFFNTYFNSEGKLENNLLLSTKTRGWENNLFTHISFLNREIDHHGSSHSNESNNNEHGDGFLDVPKTKQFNIMNRLKYTGNDKIRGSLLIKKLWEERVGGQKEDLGDYVLNTINDFSEFITKTGYIFNDIDKSIGIQTNWKLHDQIIQFGRNKYEGLQEKAYINLMLKTYVTNLNHKVVLGSSYEANRFTESFSGNIANPFFDEKRIDLLSGIFAEYNYNYKETLNIITGFRADYYNQQEKIYYSPRLHLKYNPNEKSAFRFSIGKGFRISNIIIENMNFLANNREININTKSNIESAINIGLNYSYCLYLFEREATFNFDIYNTQFEKQVIVDVENEGELNFYNLDGKSYSTSAQIDFSYELFDNLDVKTAFKINRSLTKYSDGMKQTALTPISRGLINLAYKNNKENWKFDFTCNYIGESRIPQHSKLATNKSEWFTLFNTQITNSQNNFDIYIGVENLSNYIQENPIIDSENPNSDNFDASLIYAPVMGRLFYAGLRYKFNRD
tara:strand:+ start:5627 stop:7852 length:2226 start_codon:yes stop_codon:yes gene_type:complete